jgi:hypothetical protein
VRVSRAFTEADAVDNAAVATLRNLPLESQFEVAELAGRHQVARFALRQHDRAVLRLPSCTDGFSLVAAPTVQGFAIKEQFPARRLFLGGERIRVGRKQRRNEESKSGQGNGEFHPRHLGDRPALRQ